MLGDLNLTKKLPPVNMSLARPNRTTIASLKHAYPPKVKVQHGNIYELQFDLPYYIENQQHERVRYKPVDLIRSRYLIKLNINNVTDWYVIYKIVENGSDKDIKTVYAYSLAYQLADKRIRTYKEDSKSLHDVTYDALSSSNWAVGTIADKFSSLYRSFDISSTTVLDFIFQIAEAFGALVQFDTDKKLVNFLDTDTTGQDKGLIFSYKKYLKTIQNTISGIDIKTRLYAYGSEDLTFNSVNPTGMSYIDNFSFFMNGFSRDENKNVISHSEYMSDGLCNALLDYQELTTTKQTDFKSLLTQKKTLQGTLNTKQTEMEQLKIDHDSIQDQIDIANSEGEDTFALELQLADKQTEIDSKQAEIDNIQNQIDDTDSQIASLSDEISMENNFTADQIIELNDFIFETEWSNSNYTDEQELYDQAVKELDKIASPPLVIDIDIVNFLEVVESQRDWDKLRLGDYVRIKYPEFNIDDKAQIISIDYDFGSGSINLTIANIEEVKNEQQKYLEKLYQSAVTTTTVDMNKFKFDKGVDAQSKVDELLNSAWDATKQKITAGVNECVEISRRGIIISDSTNPDDLLIIQNSTFAMSTDGGQTWKMAIDPTGIYAQYLVGEMIIGENLTISNTAGTFTVDDTGIHIDQHSLNVTDDEGNNIVDQWNATTNTVNGVNFDDLVTTTELDFNNQAIMATFSASGGVNLIRNSVGYADNSFWLVTGMVTALQNGELESHAAGSGFLVQGSMSQYINVVPGQAYTLSTLVNKDSAITGSVQIIDTSNTTNQVTIDLSNKAYNYDSVSMSIVPSGSQLQVVLTGQEQTNGIIFTNNMVNVGSTPLHWQPAPDETYNTNVRMDLNGIRVAQFEDGREVGHTIMAPDKFAGYYDVNKDGTVDETAGSVDEVFRMDKDEFVMKKATVKEEITMGTMKIVQVNSTNITGWAFVGLE